MVGSITGSSALKVCAGKQSFEDFIIQSQYCTEINGVATLHSTKLTGVSLEEYGAYCWNNEGEYLDFDLETKEAVKIVEELSNESRINQCIHIGPCAEYRMQELASQGVEAVSSMNSLDIDPILSSFWKTA